MPLALSAQLPSRCSTRRSPRADRAPSERTDGIGGTAIRPEASKGLTRADGPDNEAGAPVAQSITCHACRSPLLNGGPAFTIPAPKNDVFPSSLVHWQSSLGQSVVQAWWRTRESSLRPLPAIVSGTPAESARDACNMRRREGCAADPDIPRTTAYDGSVVALSPLASLQGSLRTFRRCHESPRRLWERRAPEPSECSDAPICRRCFGCFAAGGWTNPLTRPGSNRMVDLNLHSPPIVGSASGLPRSSNVLQPQSAGVPSPRC